MYANTLQLAYYKLSRNILDVPISLSPHRPSIKCSPFANTIVFSLSHTDDSTRYSRSSPRVTGAAAAAAVAAAVVVVDRSAVLESLAYVDDDCGEVDYGGDCSGDCGGDCGEGDCGGENALAPAVNSTMSSRLVSPDLVTNRQISEPPVLSASARTSPATLLSSSSHRSSSASTATARTSTCTSGRDKSFASNSTSVAKVTGRGGSNRSTGELTTSTTTTTTSSNGNISRASSPARSVDCRTVNVECKQNKPPSSFSKVNVVATRLGRGRPAVAVDTAGKNKSKSQSGGGGGSKSHSFGRKSTTATTSCSSSSTSSLAHNTSSYSASTIAMKNLLTTILAPTATHPGCLSSVSQRCCYDSRSFEGDRPRTTDEGSDHPAGKGAWRSDGEGVDASKSRHRDPAEDPCYRNHRRTKRHHDHCVQPAKTSSSSATSSSSFSSSSTSSTFSITDTLDEQGRSDSASQPPRADNIYLTAESPPESVVHSISKNAPFKPKSPSHRSSDPTSLTSTQRLPPKGVRHRSSDPTHCAPNSAHQARFSHAQRISDSSLTLHPDLTTTTTTTTLTTTTNNNNTTHATTIADCCFAPSDIDARVPPHPAVSQGAYSAFRTPPGSDSSEDGGPGNGRDYASTASEDPRATLQTSVCDNEGAEAEIDDYGDMEEEEMEEEMEMEEEDYEDEDEDGVPRCVDFNRYGDRQLRRLKNSIQTRNSMPMGDELKEIISKLGQYYIFINML